MWFNTSNMNHNKTVEIFILSLISSKSVYSCNYMTFMLLMAKFYDTINIIKPLQHKTQLCSNTHLHLCWFRVWMKPISFNTHRTLLDYICYIWVKCQCSYFCVYNGTVHLFVYAHKCVVEKCVSVHMQEDYPQGEPCSIRKNKQNVCIAHRSEEHTS